MGPTTFTRARIQSSVQFVRQTLDYFFVWLRKQKMVFCVRGRKK